MSDRAQPDHYIWAIKDAHDREINQLRADLERVTKERDEAKAMAERVVSHLDESSCDHYLPDLWQQIKQLEAQLVEAKESNDANWDAWSSVECKLATNRQLLKIAREQRDRAMELLNSGFPMDPSHKGPCGPDSSCDGACSGNYHYFNELGELNAEIAKEKESK